MTCETEKLVAMIADTIHDAPISGTLRLQLLGVLMRMKDDHDQHVQFTKEAIGMNEKWSAVTITLMERMAEEARTTIDDRSSQRLRRTLVEAQERLTKPLTNQAG